MLTRDLMIASLAALPLATMLCAGMLLLWPATPLWLLAVLLLLLPLWSAMALYSGGLADTRRCVRRLFAANLLLWRVLLTSYGLLSPAHGWLAHSI